MRVEINVPINLQGKNQAIALRYTIQQIVDELGRAMQKHPAWPSDIIHQAAIVSEESGEAIRAALQAKYEGGGLSHLQTEYKQTGAMALRAMYEHEVNKI